MTAVTRGFMKGYIPGAAIGSYLFVKLGASNGLVVQATAATEFLFGITTEVPALATDKVVDVVLDQTTELTLGGTVAYGARLTSNASGQGVAAATGNLFGAIALNSGVVGDRIPVFIARGVAP